MTFARVTDKVMKCFKSRTIAQVDSQVDSFNWLLMWHALEVHADCSSRMTWFIENTMVVTRQTFSSL